MQEGKVYRFRADRIHRLNPAFVEKHGYLWLYVEVDRGVRVFKSVATGKTRYFMFPNRAFTEAEDEAG